MKAQFLKKALLGPIHPAFGTIQPKLVALLDFSFWIVVSMPSKGCGKITLTCGYLFCTMFSNASRLIPG
jgi:hypothetical protein